MVLVFVAAMLAGCSPQTRGGHDTDPYQELLVEFLEKELLGLPCDKAILQLIGQGETRKTSQVGGSVRDVPQRSIALMLIAANDSDSAIDRLERLYRLGRDSCTANDLGVALLQRHASSGDVLDALRALEVLDTAIFDGHGPVMALCNRSMALSVLGLPRMSERDRASSSMMCPHSSRQQQESGSLADWEERRFSLERRLSSGEMVGRGEVQRAARRYPYYTALWVQERVLLQWSRVIKADPLLASRYLSVAQWTAEAVAQESHDSALIESLQKLSASGPDSQALWIGGHQLFGEGVAAYKQGLWAEAELTLAEAARLFSIVESPLQYWAAFYQGICIYFGSANEGYENFRRLAKGAKLAEYPMLAGRIEWLSGTAASVLGRAQEAVDRYHRAETLLRESAGPGASAFVSMLLAEAYHGRGDFATAWRYRGAAQLQVPIWESERRWLSLLNETVSALLDQDRPQLARHFAEESKLLADQWGQPLGIVASYFRSAQARLRNNDRAGARTDLEVTKEAIDRLPESGIRELTEYFYALVLGQYLQYEDPSRAITVLTEADAKQDRLGHRSERIAFLTARAEARRILGHADRRIEDLELVVGWVEEMRIQAKGRLARSESLRQARAAYESLIDINLSKNPKNVELAFALSEGVRARWITDSPLGESSIDIRSRLESVLSFGDVFVQYAVLPSRIVVWVFDNGSLRTVEIAVERKALRARIERFRAALRAPGVGGPLVKDLAARLYEDLFEPLDLRAGVRRVVVGGDRELVGLPFGALRDEKSGRYLAELFLLNLAPSAQLYVEAVRRNRIEKEGPVGMVAVAVGSGFGPEVRLPSLAGVDAEAKTIAHLYPESKLLLGTGATPSALLEILPETQVLHLAVHSLLNRERPERSALVLIPDDTFRGGLLSLEEVSSLELSDLRLVTLSACSTLRSLDSRRTEPIHLAGAFLAAGVSTVVGSYWPVDDYYSSDLMGAFHSFYRENTDAALSLKRAILLVSGTERGLVNPSQWAAFVTIGP